MPKSNLGQGQIIQTVFDAQSESLKVSPTGGVLVNEAFDYISVAYPTSSSEVYTYKTGGSGGTTVATVTVTYTDSTKENIQSVEKA